MATNKNQFYRLKKYGVFEVYFHLKSDPVEENILSFEQIRTYMFERILTFGDFKEIQRCSPRRANCVIRAFRKEKLDIGKTYTIDTYGADIIVSTYPSWSKSSSEFLMDYEKCQKQISLPDGGNIIVDCDFVDYYLHLN